MPESQHHRESNRTDIRYSTIERSAVATGSRSRAQVDEGGRDPLAAEVDRLLRELRDQLEDIKSSGTEHLAAAAQATGQVSELQKELSAEHPTRDRVVALVTGLGTSIAGIATISTAFEKLLDAVNRLFGIQ